jgi:hypothetical protein
LYLSYSIKFSADSLLLLVSSSRKGKFKLWNLFIYQLIDMLDAKALKHTKAVLVSKSRGANISSGG